MPTACQRPSTRRTRAVHDAWMARTRTEIDSEDTDVQRIVIRYGLRTEEAADLAVMHRAGLPMRREEAVAMRGAQAIDEPPADAPPVAISPSGRHVR